MAYREVSVFEIREVLRLWLRGEGYRGIDRLSGVDRKTVRRYVEAAVEAGLTPDGGEAQLTDVAIGVVCEKVRPARPAGHGAGWESLVPHEEEIKAWVAKDLKLVKVQDLLARKGVVVAYRTLNRFARWTATRPPLSSGPGRAPAAGPDHRHELPEDREHGLS